jgi:methylenetetrahydrofolate dehydrogenase (NADP+)/methenyltetrahydrofolate cyclohydrolase
MKILDGKKLSEKILRKLRKQIKKSGKNLQLAVILVGRNSISRIFIRQKESACQKIGIKFQLYQFEEKIKKEDFKKEVAKIVEDPKNSGVIIQLPLPKQIPVQEILNLIPPKKDLDLLSEKSLGRFYLGSSPILPPVTEAVRQLLKEYKIKVSGKRVVIVGSGRLVGLPLTFWFLRQEATVAVLNKSTKNISFWTNLADILVSGTGCPNLIKGKMVRKGAVVIDVGCGMYAGELTGDVEQKSVSKKAGFLAPVPGGIGPMTCACLLENLIKLNL